MIDRPGGIFVRSRGADLVRGPHRCSRRSRAPSSATAAERWLEQVSAGAGLADETCFAAARPTRSHRAELALAAPDMPRRGPDPRQSPGRIHARRARVRRSPPRSAQLTPAPWVNVLANPAFRQRRLGERPGLHLERERPRVPPDALEQRSGRRRERRGASTCATRRRGHFWSPTPLPSARRDAVRHAGTASATACSSTPRTAFTRSSGSTWTWTPPVKFSVLKVRNGSGRDAPALGNRLRRMGAGRPAAEIARCTWSPRSIPTSGALLARNAYNTEFAGRVAFFDVDDVDRTLQRRPHRVPRAQRHARAIRRP